MSYRDFLKKAQEIGNLMDHKAGTVMKPPNSLREYSQWLADFKANAEEGMLEVPGNK